MQRPLERATRLQNMVDEGLIARGMILPQEPARALLGMMVTCDNIKDCCDRLGRELDAVQQLSNHVLIHNLDVQDEDWPTKRGAQYLEGLHAVYGRCNNGNGAIFEPYASRSELPMDYSTNVANAKATGHCIEKLTDALFKPNMGQTLNKSTFSRLYDPAKAGSMLLGMHFGGAWL
jgi:hypothetical protein